jgi:hypothetical protein
MRLAPPLPLETFWQYRRWPLQPCVALPMQKLFSRAFSLCLFLPIEFATIKRVTTGSETALNEIALFVHE